MSNKKYGHNKRPIAFVKNIYSLCKYCNEQRNKMIDIILIWWIYEQKQLIITWKSDTTAKNN